MNNPLLDDSLPSTIRDELGQYVDPPVALDGIQLRGIADEPHLAVWREYAAAASDRGVLAVLRGVMPQLRFPIEPGISEAEDYRAACRRGKPAERSPGLVLAEPERLKLTIHLTLSGALPVIESSHRGDFEALVQALTARNEPERVPKSMGAAIVGGYNNWDRVARARQAFESSQPFGDWSAEFKRFTQDKSAYQDRFVLLSQGPYSAVPAAELGLDEADWTARSRTLRLDHECTHYLTARVLGSMRNSLLDELAADYIGLVGAFGHYVPAHAKRFFGLVDAGYRAGGRLENYRGELSDAAFAVVVDAARVAIDRLAMFDAAQQSRSPDQLAATVVGLFGLGLAGFLEPDGLARLDQARQSVLH